MTKFEDLKYGDLIAISYSNKFLLGIFRKVTNRSMQFWFLDWQLEDFQKDKYPSYINTFNGQRVMKINSNILDETSTKIYGRFKEILKERGICQ